MAGDNSPMIIPDYDNIVGSVIGYRNISEE